MKFNNSFKLGGTDIFLRCCSGIEDFAELVHQTHFSKTVIHPNINELEANPYIVVGHFFKFIHSQYIAKYQELVKGYIDSINNKNYLITALCGRAVIESTATLRYYNKECNKKIKNLSSTDSDKFDPKVMADLFMILNQHMRGSRFHWEKFFTSDKKTFVQDLIEKAKAKDKNTEFTEALPMPRILDSWASDMPELRLFYDFFCDLVHPNVGSNLLLMGVENGQIEIGGDSNKAVGKKICAESVMLLTPCVKEASLQLAESVLLSSLGDHIVSGTNLH